MFKKSGPEIQGWPEVAETLYGAPDRATPPFRDGTAYVPFYLPEPGPSLKSALLCNLKCLQNLAQPKGLCECLVKGSKPGSPCQRRVRTFSVTEAPVTVVTGGRLRECPVRQSPLTRKHNSQSGVEPRFGGDSAIVL